MAKYKKVLVGLDIGSDSIGWCATDENGHIIKKNGKSLWGYHGFDEAKPASERRMYRANRRRLNRRKERISLLRQLFEKEISKVDNSFFYRLDNSFYLNEDRELPFAYTLFNDRNYSDKKYYQEYPTIYHLRKRLIHDKSQADIRLIYLAMHHMIKYRGNFLNSSSSFKPMDQDEGNALFFDLNDNLSNSELESFQYNEEIFNQIKNFVTKEKYNLTQLKEKYSSLLNPSKDKYLNNVMIPLLAGGEISLNKLEIDNLESALMIGNKISVKNENFDQIIMSLINDNPNQNELINAFLDCKKIYEFFFLGKLLGEEKYLSDAMVKRYDIHKKQLEELKAYVRNNYPEKMDSIFRILNEKTNNYARYIGSTNYNNQTLRTSHVDRKEFYKFLKNELKLQNIKGNDQDEDQYLSSIVKDMNNEEYLLRQNDSNNGVFPYQINEMEMKVILENQSKYYPFLLESDEYGTTLEKIISILKYKIPYYVGPLMSPKEDHDRSKFSWVVRSDEKIKPWNFDKVVNKDESARNFITKMLTKCTYLPTCYCLPKHSIIFSYYNCLNFLNKINLCGRSITNEEKMDLITNLFKVKRKVSKKDIINYFTLKYKNNDINITFANQNKEVKEINCDMASYVDFVSIFGKDYVDNNLEQIEEVIRDITIFEDKLILQKRLEHEYQFSNDVIKKIKGLNYSKYASISKELLTDMYYLEKDENTGEVYNKFNILSILENTNQNLQEVLYDEKYRFIDIISDYNKENLPNDGLNTIEEYVENLGTVSPIMKRPLIRAYKICEEVEKIIGQRIDEYYVECTRTNKEKKVEKSSRQKHLMEVYDSAIKTESDLVRKEQLKLCKSEIEKHNPSEFRSDRIYLYYSQMGKCMYSGKAIEFSELFDDTKYQIDHIYPQSLVKDDSFNNKVLVEHRYNQAKKDNYPIPHEVLFNGNYNQALAFFKQLKEYKFISEEKYRRLVANEITEKELESFVNRQLVTTNQAVKGFINAINTLKATDDFKPKVVYSKAENVSDFRKKFELIKSRNINNFHHAHDAYLNIIVGRTLDVYFSKFRFINGVKEYLKYMQEKGYTTNVSKVFENKWNNKKDIYESDNLVWKYSDNSSIKEIKKNIYQRFDIFSTERAYYGNELFGKITILPKTIGNIPVKTNGILSDTKKYGGYKQYSFGLYSLIKVRSKNKEEFILEPIPTLFKNNIRQYLSEIYDDYEVIIESLKNNTIFYNGKLKYVISGKTGNSYVLKNKNERHFSEEAIKIIHKIEKLDERVLGKNLLSDQELSDFNLIKNDNQVIISIASSKRSNEIKLSIKELDWIYDYIIELYSKEIYSFSATTNLLNKLIEKKDKYLSLTIFEKNKLIMNLLDFLKCNQRKLIDLTFINESKSSGTILCSKVINKGIKIVYESITGYYKKVVFELK